jgi:hypothetical protein
MPNSRKKKILNHLSKVGMSLLSVSLLLGSSSASAIDSADAAAQAVTSEGGKEALNTALKIARSKPALSIAAGITCIACVPVAGVVASPGMCIACGILIAKTLG